MTSTKLSTLQTTDKLLPAIREQVRTVKSAYDLVRIDEILIAGQDNKGILIQMIADLNNFSNVSRKMTPQQIAMTANMLLDEYPRTSLQEYQAFFNKIQSGYFGQLYESLDGIKIMAFMKDFYTELVDAYHEFKEEEHNKLKRIEGHRDF